MDKSKYPGRVDETLIIINKAHVTAGFLAELHRLFCRCFANYQEVCFCFVKNIKLDSSAIKSILD